MTDATRSPIPPAEMAAYRQAARQRHRAEKEYLRVRRQRAWELARQAARLLKEQFNAERVVLFGSLTHEGQVQPLVRRGYRRLGDPARGHLAGTRSGHGPRFRN